MMRTLISCLLMILCAGSACADWLYDGYPIYNQGITIGKGRSTDMVAQPFSVPQRARIDEIGVALAGGPDPNHSGFRITLARDCREIEKTTLASWQVFPVYGPTLMFAHWTVKPLWLDPGSTYYLVVAPGDSEFVGAVAYAVRGNIALATNDEGASWFDIPQLGVRVGGTVVPEPSALVVLGVGCLMLGYWRGRRSPAS